MSEMGNLLIRLDPGQHVEIGPDIRVYFEQKAGRAGLLRIVAPKSRRVERRTGVSTKQAEELSEAAQLAEVLMEARENGN